MTAKVCRSPGCPVLIKGDAYKGRCPQCNRDAGRARGTTTEQGYGHAHQRERLAWAKRIQAGEDVECWRCRCLITDDTDMHLGHDDHDRTITRGPEHALCNLRAAADSSRGGGMPRQTP